MTTFDVAVEQCLKWEGGYCNDEGDSGGPTNFGITHNYDRQYLLPGETIKTLTKERAKEIYKTKYWKEWFDDIIDKRVAVKLFDVHVNMGWGGLSWVIKKAFGILGLKMAGTIFSSQDLEKLNGVGDKFFDTLMTAIKCRYEFLILKNPRLEKFRNGWMNRLYDLSWVEKLK